MWNLETFVGIRNSSNHVNSSHTITKGFSSWKNLIYSQLFLHVCIFFSFFDCIGSSLLRAGFLQLWQVGATLCCNARASHCSGFSFCGAWASVVVARGPSSCGSWALELRLSSCGAQAQLLHGMWDLHGPGIEPSSPALASGFLTTAPGAKSLHVWGFFNLIFIGAQLIYNVVLVSAVHQSESIIQIHISTLFQILFS